MSAAAAAAALTAAANTAAFKVLIPSPHIGGGNDSTQHGPMDHPIRMPRGWLVPPPLWQEGQPTTLSQSTLSSILPRRDDSQMIGTSYLMRRLKRLPSPPG
jgi:hypothetical protein